MLQADVTCGVICWKASTGKDEVRLSSSIKFIYIVNIIWILPQTLLVPVPC